MDTFPPEEVFAILRTARTAAPRAELPQVLGLFRREWIAIARRRYQATPADIDDAVQEAWDKLTSPAVLDRVATPTSIVPYARRVFVNCLLDTILWCPRAEGGGGGWSDGRTDQGLAAPDTADLVVQAEILAHVRAALDACPIAGLRYLSDLTVPEIERKTELSKRTIHRKLRDFRHLVERLRQDGDDGDGHSK